MKTKLEFSRYINCVVNMARMGICADNSADPAQIVDSLEYVKLSRKFFSSKDPEKLLETYRSRL